MRRRGHDKGGDERGGGKGRKEGRGQASQEGGSKKEKREEDSPICGLKSDNSIREEAKGWRLFVRGRRGGEPPFKTVDRKKRRKRKGQKNPFSRRISRGRRKEETR